MTILITGGQVILEVILSELQELDYDVIVIDNFTNGNQEVVEISLEFHL